MKLSVSCRIDDVGDDGEPVTHIDLPFAPFPGLFIRLEHLWLVKEVVWIEEEEELVLLCEIQ